MIGTYTINKTDRSITVVDELGHELSPEAIKALAEAMLDSLRDQPYARLLFKDGEPDQLVLLEKKKRKKSAEKTEEEIRASKRTREILTLYAKLRAMTMQQIALPMDELMSLLPTAIFAQIDYGREGQSAQKLSKDQRCITDRQIVGCYKWLSTAKEHRFFFAAKSPTLHDVLDRMDRYLSLIPQSPKVVINDTQRAAAYRTIENDVNF